MTSIRIISDLLKISTTLQNISNESLLDTLSPNSGAGLLVECLTVDNGRQAGRQDQGCGHSNQARWETSWETRERRDQGGGHSIPAKAATLKTALRTPTVNCLGKYRFFKHHQSSVTLSTHISFSCNMM